MSPKTALMSPPAWVGTSLCVSVMSIVDVNETLLLGPSILSCESLTFEEGGVEGQRAKTIFVTTAQDSCELYVAFLAISNAL